MTTEPMSKEDYAELRAWNDSMDSWQRELNSLCWATVCQLNLGAIERAQQTAIAADELHNGIMDKIAERRARDKQRATEVAAAEAGQEVS